LTPQRWSLGGLFAVFAAVGGVTAANRAGLFDLAALASSPRSAGEGKVWLLMTSAFVADKLLRSPLPFSSPAGRGCSGSRRWLGT
jgi:hypothetical protein